MMQGVLSLYVSVPVASFRVSRAREYFETYPCPPPSTIYGMLLSLVGEVDRSQHEGAEIALALLSEPDLSVVLRTLWRIKKSNLPPGLGMNKRPDFQELLTGIRLAVWIKNGVDEKATPTLAERMAYALKNPGSLNRFGGLSLGESTHLVDEIRELRSMDGLECRYLMADRQGNLTLPVWPDHVGSSSRWEQYRLTQSAIQDEIPAQAWTTIKKPEKEG